MTVKLQVVGKNTYWVTPFKLFNNVDLNTKVDTCGAYNFFYDNRTIAFVINRLDDCQVELSLTSSVQITARFATTIDGFFVNDNEATFLDKTTAFLHIPFSDLRIVNARDGKTLRMLQNSTTNDTATTSPAADSGPLL